ncbi:hypothetical protein ABIB68_005927 [Bradyrhizobium sp. F1.2.2]|uniref:hypothetical protein n=1 Tax=unclassified Bradyrhizobium TaxID=2631580 RepID=UPI0033915474
MLVMLSLRLSKAVAGGRPAASASARPTQIAVYPRNCWVMESPNPVARLWQLFTRATY